MTSVSRFFFACAGVFDDATLQDGILDGKQWSVYVQMHGCFLVRCMMNGVPLPFPPLVKAPYSIAEKQITYKELFIEKVLRKC